MVVANITTNLLQMQQASFTLINLVFYENCNCSGNAEELSGYYGCSWLIFVACSLVLIIFNGAVNWVFKQGDATYALTAYRRRRQDGVLKDGVPTDQIISQLAFHTMGSWRRLGRALGIEDTVITQIQVDEQDNYERAYTLLNKWRQQMGAGASYEALAQALECEIVRRPDLSQKFCYTMD